MKARTIRFIAYLALLTLGVGLMLVSIRWLNGVGLMLALSSSLLSSRRGPGILRQLVRLVIIAVVVGLVVASTSDTISHPLWYWLVVIGAWAWGVNREFRFWRGDEDTNRMPNTALEPTAAALSVLDVPSNPKAGGDSTSASSGGGSALDR